MLRLAIKIEETLPLPSVLVCPTLPDLLHPAQPSSQIHKMLLITSSNMVRGKVASHVEKISIHVEGQVLEEEEAKLERMAEVPNEVCVTCISPDGILTARFLHIKSTGTTIGRFVC